MRWPYVSILHVGKKWEMPYDHCVCPRHPVWTNSYGLSMGFQVATCTIELRNVDPELINPSFSIAGASLNVALLEGPHTPPPHLPSKLGVDSSEINITKVAREQRILSLRGLRRVFLFGRRDSTPRLRLGRLARQALAASPLSASQGARGAVGQLRRGVGVAGRA